MTWLKVCGHMRPQEVAYSVAAGVDALGFVVEFPSPVPWNLTRAAAAPLLAGVPEDRESVLVVGDDPELVVALADHLHPTAVQLHADEAPSVTEALIPELHRRGVQVIKALRVDPETGWLVTRHEGLPADAVEAARRLAETGVNRLLVDAYSPARAGGTGLRVDTGIAQAVREAVDVPVILAGGLRADNVAAAIRAVRPFGVDVLSGAEDENHHKVPALIDAFVTAARQA